MSKAVKVDDFYNNGTTSTTNYIEEIFTTATNVGNQVHLFSNIFFPIRDFIFENDQVVGMADTVTYYNVGLTTTELADLYWTEYSGNYLLGAGACKAWADDKDALEKRVTSIFKKNKGKYMKLIEYYGLEWNPLWNVDGTELKQILEEHGNEVRTPNLTETTTPTNKTLTHNVAPYDGGTKVEWSDVESGSESTTKTGSETLSHTALGYNVSASDAALGISVTNGGDILHTEKFIRQGNIGVTETTKLLEDAKDFFRYSIIEEFFKDINEVILVGIFYSMPDTPWWYQQSAPTPTPSYEHPDTGRIDSVTNSAYDLIQSVQLDQYGHVIGLTTCDGVTKVFTPMTQAQYDQTDPKDQALYHIYE